MSTYPDLLSTGHAGEPAASLLTGGLHPTQGGSPFPPVMHLIREDERMSAQRAISPVLPRQAEPAD